MKKQTATKKALEGLARYLEQAGHSVEKIEAAKSAVPLTREQISLQCDAVLIYIQKPAAFTVKVCDECGESFGTNYHHVAKCSDYCRARALQRQTGIRWNPHKSQREAWGGEPPLIIPPEALKSLEGFARQLLLEIGLKDVPTKIVAGKTYRSTEAIQNQTEILESLYGPPSQLQDFVDEQSHQSKSEVDTSPAQSLPLLQEKEFAVAESPFDF